MTKTKPTTFNENIHNKFVELEAIMISKQKDYGPKNILQAPIDPRLALLVRMNDKVQRLVNLILSGAEPENEAREDAWKDFANYGVIGWCIEEGNFDLPLATES